MKQEHLGESFIFSGAIIWSLFPIITVLSYKGVPSMVSLAISTFFASICFLILIIYKKKFYELKNILLWKYIFGIVVSIGILYYVFYYFGLTKTTPGNASIISLFEVFTSYMLFNIFRKEHFSFESKVGSTLMVLGAIIVLAPNFSSFNFGDLFILFATFCAPIGNLLQQKAKRISSTETILFLRSIVATPFLFLLVYVFGQGFHIYQIKESIWFLIFNGVIIFGFSKMFWIEGIHRISVTKANALSSLAPLFTLFVAWLWLHQIPTIWQVASLVPFFFGVLLLTNNLKLKNNLKTI